MSVKSESKNWSEEEESEYLELLIEDAIDDSKINFFLFCNTLAPDFYKHERNHLIRLCDTLQALYEGRIVRDYDDEEWTITDAPEEYIQVCKKLIINMPPQHGKSRTLINFCMWALGQNPNEKIITGSYNDTLAQEFSKYTRDGIAETKNQPTDIVYNDIFPDVKLKKGDSSYGRWALEGQHFTYIGVGAKGSVTGKGGTIRIIDDPVKDAEEAVNETALEKKWVWIDSTFRSRSDASTGGQPLEIINQTRWSENDPAGKMLSSPEAHEWFVLKMPAYDKETDSMLCEQMFNRETYLKRKATASKNVITEFIFDANYDQETVDKENQLYKPFKTYAELPSRIESRGNYTDTADDGADYLSSGYYVKSNGFIYMTDILHTVKPQEETEPLTVQRIRLNETRTMHIESNNGGKGFARSIQRICNEQRIPVVVNWFHQSKNKITRILTNAPLVNDKILFPEDWKVRWPEFAAQVTKYQRIGKNKHDDGPDMLTGIVEKELFYTQQDSSSYISEY